MNAAPVSAPLQILGHTKLECFHPSSGQIFASKASNHKMFIIQALIWSNICSGELTGALLKVAPVSAPLQILDHIRGLYYKHFTIVNDDRK